MTSRGQLFKMRVTMQTRGAGELMIGQTDRDSTSFSIKRKITVLQATLEEQIHAMY